VLLHFHCHSLLDLEFIESLAFGFLLNLLFEFLLQPKHFDHSWLIFFHHFDDVISAWMAWNLRDNVEKGFVPVN
jgi:hypothetical protein